MAYKGRFKPFNPQKYKGDPTNIVYRSRWELVLMQRLDQHPDVIEWSSEEIIIPYISPIDNKMHRYFPDFFVKRKGYDGKIESMIIEVKPHAQTKPPEVQRRATKRYITEVHTWGINSSKWKYARAYCEDRGWKFIIMTENELGLKFKCPQFLTQSSLKVYAPVKYLRELKTRVSGFVMLLQAINESMKKQ